MRPLPMRYRIRRAWCAFRHWPLWTLSVMDEFRLTRGAVKVTIACPICGIHFEELYKARP